MENRKKRIGISFSRTNFHYYWDWFNEEEKGEVERIELSFEKNNLDSYAGHGILRWKYSFYPG